MTKPDKLTLPLSRDLLERLARFQEVELQDSREVVRDWGRPGVK